MKTLFEMINLQKENNNSGVILINNKEEVFMSYKELYSEARIFLQVLKNKGVQLNNEIIILTSNISKFLMCFWACILGGYIAVPVSCSNSFEGKTKVANISNKLNNPFIFSGENMLGKLNEFAQETSNSRLLNILKDRSIDYNFIHNDTGIEDISVISPDKDDIAFIQFSSGSTGSPKGVTLTHNNLITNIRAIVRAIGTYECSDSSLSWLPLSHDMGLIGFHLTPMYCGINQYLMQPMLFMKKPMLWLGKVNEHRSTIINSPNFGYEYFMKMYSKEKAEDWNLNCIRVIFNGAEPINYDTCSKFSELLSKNNLSENAIFPVYGMAEASLAVTFPSVNDSIEAVCVDRKNLNIGSTVKQVSVNNVEGVKFVKLGSAIDDCNYRITNDTGENVGECIVGNIEICGDNVTNGYYNDSQNTKNSFTDDLWLKTGDIGFTIDENLVITGRKKEMIIVNGENYFPNDIERMVAKGINQDRYNVAVIGVMNNKTKVEEIIVFFNSREIDKNTIKTCNIVKRIIRIYVGVNAKSIPVRNLPKTSSGKIQRVLLKQRYLNNYYLEIEEKVDMLYEEVKLNSTIYQPSTAVAKKLKKIFKETFPGIDINGNESFADYGINSLHFITLLDKVNYYYPNCNIEISSLFTYHTIQDLAKYIEEQEEKYKHNAFKQKEVIYDIDQLLNDL